MIELRTCPECGVPEYITGEYLWLSNGDIVEARAQGNRIVFFESENIDSLYQNIESVIGAPIEHLVITTIRRAVRHFVSLLVPKEVRALIHAKELDPLPIALAMMDVSSMMGYGRQEFIDYRYEKDDDDYYTVKMFEPFSVPMFSGTIAGAVEAVLEGERGVTCEELSPDVYKVTVFPSPHPKGLKGKLKAQRYRPQANGIEVEKCTTCGGPRELRGYQWHLERGVILNRANGRRMVMMGPQQMDLIFKELEAELGDIIPQAVVEAQRRFTANGFYSLRDYEDVEDFGNQLVLRGLGNLRDLQVSRRGIRMRLDNTVLHLMIVGTLQGAFDAAMGKDSNVEWELSENGDLQMEVTPAS